MKYQGGLVLGMEWYPVSKLKMPRWRDDKRLRPKNTIFVLSERESNLALVENTAINTLYQWILCC